MNRRKALILLLSAIVVASLVLLSASLSHVVFEEARSPFISQKEAPTEPGTSTFSESEINLFWQKALRIIMVVMVVLFAASIITVIIWPKSLKRILRDAITTAAVVWVFYFLLTRFRPFKLDEATTGGAPGQPSAVVYNPLDFGAVNAPSWLVFLFVLCGIAFLALIVWGLARFWRSDVGEKTELKELALLAAETAEQIKAGMGVKNAVLRCYRDMCELLSQRRGVPLERAMTAREFEMRLAAVGVRDEHVSRLSRLFEWVRYGRKEASASEERDAIECFEVIAKTYGSPS